MGGFGSERKPKKARDGEKRIELPPLDGTPPDVLDAYGREVWERVFPGAAKSGLLRAADGPLFLMYCASMGAFNLALHELKKGGFMRTIARKRGGELSSFCPTDDRTEASVSHLPHGTTSSGTRWPTLRGAIPFSDSLRSIAAGRSGRQRGKTRERPRRPVPARPSTGSACLSARPTTRRDLFT